jgi:hypothetical protein
MSSGISYVQKEYLEIVSSYELTPEDIEELVRRCNNVNHEQITVDDVINDPGEYDQEIKDYMSDGGFEFDEVSREETDYDWWIE